MKIGDVVYMYDNWHRRGSIMESRFVPYTITGETRQSWILDRVIKVDKTTMRVRGHNSNTDGLIYTTAGKVDKIWQETNRTQLMRAIERADTATLRKIAELIGYEAE